MKLENSIKMLLIWYILPSNVKIFSVLCFDKDPQNFIKTS